ncbi:MBL fold metallo-hydrolase [Mycolicibacterium mucogenicum]|uniref:MBL fold metallo-hydrolase n=1 Tax=Mycolicibacterium sp. lyk4-40-TYG-92 TaxID=3040295 RepID=UPI00226AB2EE|nr:MULTISPECIES: MBL fold metallo-hydrolase [Mycolicibacterium]MCX8564898.1 MBL fold metallo-hydrolase [Mycolicibacterium mucogenicum]
MARIPLPLPLPDLTVVNAYAVGTDAGVTLIDPGWATADSEAALIDGLHALGYEVSDVRQILVTHAHWDHYTQAVKWRDDLGIELMLGAEERHSISAFDALAGVHPNQVPVLHRAGAPALAEAVAALQWETYEQGMPFTAPDRWLRGGDVVDAGGASITVRATPGHTRGHMVFEISGMAFTGDHLLPRITPSVAFERAPEKLPLRSFLQSLQLFVELPDARMLPAHGGTDHYTRRRAQELLDHHDERLSIVADLVSSGAATAFEVAARMRWTRRDRALTELETVHQMTAVLEVLAHLELLVTQGLLCVDESGDVNNFTVS